jgi:hypothetical protein
MARRAVPVGLVVAAAAADGAGLHGLAFYALLLAIPGAAAVALEEVGGLVERQGDHLRALLWGLVLALTVVGTAVRASAVSGTVPALARSALLGCLAIFCVQATIAAAAEFRRR